MTTIPNESDRGEPRHTSGSRVATSRFFRESREDHALTASRHAHSPAGRGGAGAKRPRAGGTQERGAGLAAPGRPPAGGPWHYAKHVSALLDPAADQRKSRRHVRHALRSVLWGESSLERVRKCGRVPVTEVGDVAVKKNGDVAHYAGLATCGSISACPVCSAKIRATRAEEISSGTALWDRRGGAVYMATFTTRHHLGMALKPLLEMISGAFSSILSGRRWLQVKEELGIVGNIRSLETTHGKNGWHPHLHVLFYFEREITPVQLAGFIGYLRTKWKAQVAKAGYELPSDLHGVDVTRCHSAQEAGAYIAKTQDGRAVGNEVTREDMKTARQGGRTPFDVLDDFRWTGDAADLALWHEYEQAMHRKQVITWSKGLKHLLAVEEQTDEDIAEEDIGGEELARIPNETWKAITKVPGLTSAILDAAENTYGLDAITNLLTRLSIDSSGIHRPTRRS